MLQKPGIPVNQVLEDPGEGPEWVHNLRNPEFNSNIKRQHGVENTYECKFPVHAMTTNTVNAKVPTSCTCQKATCLILGVSLLSRSEKWYMAMSRPYASVHQCGNWFLFKDSKSFSDPVTG